LHDALDDWLDGGPGIVAPLPAQRSLLRSGFATRFGGRLGSTRGELEKGVPRDPRVRVSPGIARDVSQESQRSGTAAASAPYPVGFMCRWSPTS